MHSYTFKEETRVHASRQFGRGALHASIINKHKCVGGDTEEPSATPDYYDRLYITFEGTRK
jgi:hypothetical protein